MFRMIDGVSELQRWLLY